MDGKMADTEQSNGTIDIYTVLMEINWISSRGWDAPTAMDKNTRGLDIVL